MRIHLLPLVSLFALACGRADVQPTVEIRSPTTADEFDGHANIDVRVAIEDDSNDPIDVEFYIDGELAGTAVAEKCRNGCQVNGVASTLEFDEGPHLLTVEVVDKNGTRGKSEDQDIDSEESGPLVDEFCEDDVCQPGLLFSVFDVPYVDTLAVHNTNEGGLNGPGIEVEVHILDEETARYRGCAGLLDIQEDDLPYEDLSAPFVYNADGAVLRYQDVAFTPIRVVVVESDNGNHCPEWPELTELFETDVDELYGLSATVDLSLLFNDDEIVLNNADFSGLVIKKGRPVNAD